MSQSATRFFINRLPELQPGCHVPQNDDHWKKLAWHTSSSILQNQPATLSTCDGGLYVGCAGIGYMFYHMAVSQVFAEQKQELLVKARNYIDVALSYCASRHNRDPPASFLLGSAGVYAVAAVIYDQMGDGSKRDEFVSQYRVLCAACLPRDFLPHGSDELFVGRAGYLCGAMFLNKRLGQEVISRSELLKVCKSIISSGQHYAKKHHSKAPLMYGYYETEYLGAAHGLSSILQMMLFFPEVTQSNPEVRASIDYLLGILQPNGNLAPAMDELANPRLAEHELVHWCHGGPGVIYLFARAYKCWKDERYLNACLKIGELTWQKGLLKKGPGICHGVAGSAYVFLLLYRITHDEKHLHRATKFAEFLNSDEFTKGARRPDAPYSLYEGFAGTVCFLTDLVQPQQAAFPFFEVLK